MKKVLFVILFVIGLSVPAAAFEDNLSCADQEMSCRVECTEDFSKTQEEVDSCVSGCEAEYEECLG
jgi:hypothetical protein